MKTPKCPDCAVAMKEGWTPDAVEWFRAQPYWEAGTLKGKKGGRRIPVQTFRCPECGLLRSYAFPKKWNKVE